jgi:hypothetical protein
MLTFSTERITGDVLEAHTHYWVEFLDHPYFERVWTLQETAVANHPLLICGNSTLPFDAAKFALFLIHPYISQTFHGADVPRVSRRLRGFETHQYLAKVFQQKDHGQAWKRPQDINSFREILFSVRSLQASQIPDKLFSLYTILAGFCPGFPAPEKGLSPKDLWPSATVSIIRSMRCLDLIMNTHYRATSDLPSWSFDWTSEEIHRTQWDAANDVLLKALPPASAWHHEPNFDLRCGSEKRKILRIKGLRCSKIKIRSRSQREAREWLTNNENMPVMELKAQHSFISLMQETMIILFESTIPNIVESELEDGEYKKRCRELLVWNKVPEDPHYKYFEEWYPLMVELKYLYQCEAPDRKEIKAVQKKLGYIGWGLEFHIQMCVNRLWRCFFRTEDGRIGDGYHTIREGDLVVLLCWAKVPAILRPIEEDPSLYTLVSFVYIQGLVDCHAWDMKEEDLEEFTII